MMFNNWIDNQQVAQDAKNLGDEVRRLKRVEALAIEVVKASRETFPTGNKSPLGLALGKLEVLCFQQ